MIGIIGAQTNITDEVGSYYMGIKKTQYDTAAVLAVPNYKIQEFASQQEFDDYISAPDYKTKVSIRKSISGVCFGLEHFKDNDTAPNNYTFSLHYPDKKIGFNPKSYA